MYELKRINSTAFNRWQMKRHYLKRPIIKTKMLAHGIFIDGELVGGLLWVTPHFTKKKGLFGYPGLYDKWQVLVLGRFYLIDNSGIIASQVMSESIGRGKGRGSHRRGWRIQRDWILANPPKYPDEPFVPRLLMSWSDTTYGHKGTIYSAGGWSHWDTTNSSGNRTGAQAKKGEKKCWVLELSHNRRVEKMGRELSPVQGRLL